MSDTNSANDLDLPVDDNPFLKVKEAFAAALPTRRYDFELHGLPCHVTVGAMDAEAYSAYQRVLQEMQVPVEMIRDRRTAKGVHLTMNPDIFKANLVLLSHSIRDFVLAQQIIKGGELVGRPLVGAGLSKTEREGVFRRLKPDLFETMVQVCLEINHLDAPSENTDPNGAVVADGTEPSAPAFTSSDENTENS